MTILTTNTEQLRIEVANHLAADAVIQGDYWDGQRGCFIGCLAHSDNAAELERQYGFPLPLVRICERIFEQLPIEEAKLFFAAIPDAIGRDGRDLSRVAWQFLAQELRSLLPQPADVQAVIDPVITGLDLLASGQEWPGLKSADLAVKAAAEATRAAAKDDSGATVAAARFAAKAADAASWAVDAFWWAADAADEAFWAAAEAATRASWSVDDPNLTTATRRQRDLLLRLLAEA